MDPRMQVKGLPKVLELSTIWYTSTPVPTRTKKTAMKHMVRHAKSSWMGTLLPCCLQARR